MFAAVAMIVVRMADDYLVTQRINEKQASVENIAVRMASYLRESDGDGLYDLALESSKNTGGRYLVLDSLGVVQTDSFSKLNGSRFLFPEVSDVLSGTKDISYGFHRIYNSDDPNDYFWAVYYTSAILDGPRVIGALLFSDSIQDVVEQTEKLTMGIVMLSFGACLVVIFISLLLSGYITKPILQLRNVAQKIADGHFDQRVRVSGRNEIAQLGDAFNRMSEKLENLDIQRNEFVSNASHELRTPLSSIKILVESLLYQEKMDPKITKEFLGDINNEIDRLNNIISDLLAITRLDDQAESLNMEAVSMQKLLEKTALALKPLADKKDIAMEMQLEGEVITKCDPLKIRQAVANLIDNAIKYTNNGGRVWVRLFSSQGYAKIEVEDTGQGMGEEHLHHVFERFYRVDKARSRETGGTGLGLYITQRIVTLHGGTISVHSEEGKGTIFIIFLPVIAPDEQVAK